MTAMFDLFEAPAVPGFSIQKDMLTVRQEAALIAHIDESGLSPFRFQQWTGKRLTRSYGWSYDFETGKFAPTDPLPDWLDIVRTKAATAWKRRRQRSAPPSPRSHPFATNVDNPSREILNHATILISVTVRSTNWSMHLLDTSSRPN